MYFLQILLKNCLQHLNGINGLIFSGNSAVFSFLSFKFLFFKKIKTCNPLIRKKLPKNYLNCWSLSDFGVYPLILGALLFEIHTKKY